jgi:hypothetical protein
MGIHGQRFASAQKNDLARRDPSPAIMANTRLPTALTGAIFGAGGEIFVR